MSRSARYVSSGINQSGLTAVTSHQRTDRQSGAHTSLRYTGTLYTGLKAASGLLIEITQNVFSDHSQIKLEINEKKLYLENFQVFRNSESFLNSP